MIKTFLRYSFLAIIIVGLIPSCFWDNERWLRWLWWWSYGQLESDVPYSLSNDPECDSTDLWNCISVKENEDTIIIRLLQVFGLDDSREKDLKFIDYARAILNMALGLLAFIALIMTIYTFYLMFFTENEAWAKKAKWNLVGIFIALAIIWLAWLIVSFIFWWYQSNWKEQEKTIESWHVNEIWVFYDEN